MHQAVKYKLVLYKPCFFLCYNKKVLVKCYCVNTGQGTRQLIDAYCDNSEL